MIFKGITPLKFESDRHIAKNKGGKKCSFKINLVFLKLLIDQYVYNSPRFSHFR